MHRYNQIINSYNQLFGKIFDTPGMRILQKNQQRLRELYTPIEIPKFGMHSQIGDAMKDIQKLNSFYSSEIQNALAPIQELNSVFETLIKNNDIQRYIASIFSFK